jgi:membrane protease subunit (stomatin/prohibitin family)
LSILDFLRGEFIDVIHWTDDTRDTIVWRFERQGHAIKYGAKLTVREGRRRSSCTRASSPTSSLPGSTC